MAPQPNWFFGGRPSGSQPSDNPFGGFDLGGVQNPGSPLIQSSVATPNPASAGVAGSTPGQPPSPSPTGGMDALRSPFDQPDQTGGAPEGTAAPSNANVTGFDPGLANTALTFATLGLPSPFAALGPLTGPLTSLAARMGIHAGINSLPSNMTDVNGNPVMYSGNNMLGLPTGQLRSMDPETNQTFPVPFQSPNMGAFGGIAGSATVDGAIPSTFTAGRGQTSAPGIFGAPDARPNDPTTPSLNDPAAPAPDTSPNSGVAPDTGNTGPTGPAGGDTGASAGGDAGVGPGGYKKGGRVQRPDPRRLADRLRQGAKVDVGSPRSRTDNVRNVDLQTGEEVMNRPAVRAHAEQLDEWNQEGRRSMGRSAGGFSVGRPRSGRR